MAVICVDARHAQAALSMRLNKTDRNDAAGLAQLMRMGWYREVQVKQLVAHGDGALLASRALLVRQRCELENQIRGLMKNVGLRARATKGRAFEQSVCAVVRHATLKDIIMPLLAVWSQLRQQIAVLTAHVRARASASASCRRLMTMPGVGPMTALAFQAAIDDPLRFKHSRSVGAYVGLTPRRYSSGEMDRMGRISRCRRRLDAQLSLRGRQHHAHALAQLQCVAQLGRQACQACRVQEGARGTGPQDGGGAASHVGRWNRLRRAKARGMTKRGQRP